MRRALRVGFSFGVPSGIITTLGLMVGLNSITQSQSVVIGGILTIAVADSLSDALGIHISQESENHLSHKDVWKSTICTLIAKFIFSSIFVIPVLIFDLQIAIYVSIMIGLYLIFLISLIIARLKEDNIIKVVCEHLIVTIFVIIAAHYAGILIHATFG